MKKKDNTKVDPRTPNQWKLHQQIALQAFDIDKLPDASEVRENTPRAAPLNLLPMVF